ncbi:hypothetical protein PJG4_107 [Pseudomonas phage JG004]|uniref:Uncharacterized protein n=1 Tax=Pseudomonas phage JG004 TaxID=757342 RepID=F4YDN3_9CAUD|nr:hypothetical protein PJG4_107 [Pseudomonas phage JG004]ADF58181.1 hypothetical protein PJG4_107 [Pseudomonas phage JG004]
MDHYFLVLPVSTVNPATHAHVVDAVGCHFDISCIVRPLYHKECGNVKHPLHFDPMEPLHLGHKEVGIFLHFIIPSLKLHKADNLSIPAGCPIHIVGSR